MTDVVVGDARAIHLPDLRRSRAGKSRFRGVRCIHTHLHEEALTHEDLTDLSLMRLDTMSVLEVLPGGAPGRLHTAHIRPDFEAGKDLGDADFWTVLPPMDTRDPDFDYASFIRDLESEFARKTPPTWRNPDGEYAILVGVTTGSAEAERSRMPELRELARSAGIEVLDSFVQRRAKLDPRYLIGKGKLREILMRAVQMGATLLVFNRELSPTQGRAVCRETDLKVIDRTQLILDIFASRARSQEGKIQVELAQLKYLMPRLVEFDDSLSRLTGGIGARGPGETSLEVNRRRLRVKIGTLEDRLESVRMARGARRARRRRRGVPVVSIVGYTNAGKSTLFNLLTRSTAFTEDKVFATLDPTSRRLRLPWEKDVVVQDTVGFIRDLPEDLMEAFKATLEEIEESDLLVLLADVSDPDMEDRIRAVEHVLDLLGVLDIPRLLVLNKSDRVPAEGRAHLERLHGAPLVSALDERDGRRVRDMVCERLEIAVSGPAEEGASQPDTTDRRNSPCTT